MTFNSLKLLSAFVMVAMLSFIVRFGEVVTDFKSYEQAVTASAVAADDKKDNEEKVDVDVPEGLPDTEPAPFPETDWADPTTVDMEFSETQAMVLEELKERREALDARESRLNQRDALLQVTEKRVEEKIAELEQIRTEIQDLLGQQSEEEEARMQSLVKIYEGMKPKEAAAIFNDLDMDILLQVVGRMSERRTAPILADMNIKKAQELTTLLAKQKTLPEVPEE